MLCCNKIQMFNLFIYFSSIIQLTKTPHLLHTNSIKPAAPLLASVLRWVFFCPDPVAMKAGGVS